MRGYTTETSWEHWREVDQAMIRACTEVWVIKFDGWQGSKGIDAEMRYARILGIDKNVWYYTPEQLSDKCRKHQARSGNSSTENLARLTDVIRDAHTPEPGV